MSVFGARRHTARVADGLNLLTFKFRFVRSLFSNSWHLVKRFNFAPAGFTVLFAVGFPPHYGFQRRWWINV